MAEQALFRGNDLDGIMMSYNFFLLPGNYQPLGRGHVHDAGAAAAGSAASLPSPLQVEEAERCRGFVQQRLASHPPSPQQGWALSRLCTASVAAYKQV